MACKYCGEAWVETYTNHCERCGDWLRFIRDRPELAAAIFTDVSKTGDSKNAARYRWLRAFGGHPLKVVDRNHDAEYYETALDAAIDREMMGDCDQQGTSAGDG